MPASAVLKVSGMLSCLLLAGTYPPAAFAVQNSQGLQFDSASCESSAFGDVAACGDSDFDIDIDQPAQPQLSSHAGVTPAALGGSGCSATVNATASTAVTAGGVTGAALVQGSVEGGPYDALVNSSGAMSSQTAEYVVQCPSDFKEPVIRGTFSVQLTKTDWDGWYRDLGTQVTGPGVDITVDYNGVSGFYTTAAGVVNVDNPGTSGLSAAFEVPANCGGSVEFTVTTSIGHFPPVVSGFDPESVSASTSGSISGHVEDK